MSDVVLRTLGTMAFATSIYWLASTIAARLKAWSGKHERNR